MPSRIHNDLCCMKACLNLLLLSLVLGPATLLAQGISKHDEFLPKSGKGPVVVVITGKRRRMPGRARIRSGT